MKSVCAIIAGSIVLSATATADLKLTASKGHPFGVGKLEYTDDGNETDAVLKALDCQAHRNMLLQPGDHVFYPVVDCRPPGRKEGNFTRGWTVHFLFRPAEQITVTAPNGKQLTATVEHDAHSRHALNTWWKLYTNRVVQNSRRDLYRHRLINT